MIGYFEVLDELVPEVFLAPEVLLADEVLPDFLVEFLVERTCETTFLALSLMNSATSGALSLANSSTFSTWCWTRGSFQNFVAARLISS
jgi:hypothetical protein